MARVAIFIDGGYLDYVLRDEFGSARIDYEAFARELSGGMEILRTYYYHCPPYQSDPATEEESERFRNAERFFNRLERLPRFDVKRGKLAFRGIDKETGKKIFEQKRVDVLLAVDMVILATSRQITDMVLVAGDSDYCPAVEAAKANGVLVKLCHGTVAPPHRDLWQACDERVALSASLIESIARRDRRSS